MATRIPKRRLIIISVGIAIIFPLIYFRIYYLTVKNQDRYVEQAKKQQNLFVPIQPDRGVILDRNRKELAMNLDVPSIAANPRALSAKARAKLIGVLPEILHLSPEFVEKRLTKKKGFVWLKRQVTEEEADAIRHLDMTQLMIQTEAKRFYPNGNMLAHLLGFCDIDNKGVEGMELLYDEKLTGRSGYRRTKRDRMLRAVVALEEKFVPEVNGANLHLTIDQYIQHYTEKALDEAYKKWNAKSAVAAVMNPHTGEILSMATRPTFDPNNRDASAIENKRNRPITDIFEPGSIFKAVTASSALNEGVSTIDEKIDCENGEWRARPRRVIHDVHPYGELTFSEVLIKSSNIGTVKIAKKLGEKKLYEYIRKFGFGQKTGIDFPGEVVGILRPVEKWSKYSITTIPFGQEVAATAIQMLRAISVIANGGSLVEPYILEKITDDSGVTLYQKEQKKEAPFLKPEVAETMRAIMARVVDEGTGKRARIDGVSVAGKTGTTQKLDPNGGYSHSHFVGSFVGFAPADKPKLAMIVAIDDPAPRYYGGTVAAPVFKDVIEKSLIYMGYMGDQDVKVTQVLLKPAHVKTAAPKSEPREPAVSAA